jgi:hypothetical protein
MSDNIPDCVASCTVHADAATISTCAVRACPGDLSQCRQVAAGFLLLFMYGLAVIPLAYCQGFSFGNPTAAQARLIHVGYAAPVLRT